MPVSLFRGSRGRFVKVKHENTNSSSQTAENNGTCDGILNIGERTSLLDRFGTHEAALNAGVHNRSTSKGGEHLEKFINVF